MGLMSNYETLPITQQVRLAGTVEYIHILKSNCNSRQKKKDCVLVLESPNIQLIDFFLSKPKWEEHLLLLFKVYIVTFIKILLGFNSDTVKVQNNFTLIFNYKLMLA